MSRKILIIARLTARELLAERIIPIVGGLCVIFFCLLSFLNYFDRAEQIKIVQDMGLTFFSFFAFMLVLFGVPTVIHAGDERARDVLFITKPITRADYITGKTFGVLVVMSISLAALAVIMLGVIVVRCGSVERVVVAALYLMYLKYVVFLTIIVVISVVCNPFVVYFAGSAIFIFANASAYFETMARQMGNTLATYVAVFLQVILPRFDHFNAVEAITLNKAIPAEYLLKVTGYACVYAAVALIAARVLYARKEF
jgi:ABC-type transport system involved in multi-copper enzyme maturation permease subunit